jgi:hypothetical protein
VTADLFQRHFQRQCRAVGAMRGHRFHYVGNGQDPGFFENAVS